MPAVKKHHKKATRGTHEPAAQVSPLEPGVFHGKRTQTGNSLALRFDRALFKSHPEFCGNVEAHVIAPGRMLVVAAEPSTAPRQDPVIASFISFLAADMQRYPQRIQPLDAGLVAQIERLTQGMSNSSEESLGDEELL